MNNNVVLKAVGLQKSYKEGGRLLHVLKDVNLEFTRGESVAIVGTSGSGKTTLLQCIGGLDRFDKGLIEIGGENIAELSEQRLTELRNRKLGFVYRSTICCRNLRHGNVAMPLKIRREKASVAQKDGKPAQSHGSCRPRGSSAESLSGGERQRVAIARAVSGFRCVFLADEPTGNLDGETAEVVIDYLLKLSSSQGALIVTHDSDIAIMRSVVRLKNRRLA